MSQKVRPHDDDHAGGHPHDDDDHAGGHPHDDDDHAGGHPHDHPSGLLGRLREWLPFGHGHSHAAEAKIDRALESSERGIWALKVSLLGLGATALFQLVIVAISGSAALLADTIHNFSDALTAVPLWIAFVLGRRAPNRRYTYGYGRAEDVAGALIVVMIFASAVVAGYESYRKLIDPQPLSNVGWVIAAAIVGFLGNEAVAIFRIRIGREIGSAALIADGQHARADGFTSLAVLFGALGSLAGFPLADPIVGLLITVAILLIVKDAAVAMWRRLMDAVDPELVAAIEREAAGTAGVQEVHDVRVRWVGHRLHAELHVTVDEDLPTRDSHRIAEDVRHGLFHSLPQLTAVSVHIDPCGHSGEDHHAPTAHHHPMSREAPA
jgi:cation diffusion facilitator family transporter